jgi:hypothetical protein
MPDRENFDHAGVVLNLIEDAVVAHPNPPQV